MAAAAAEEELVLLSRDDKNVSLAVIPPAAAPDAAADAATTVTFRLVVEQAYVGGGAGGAEDDVDTMEDVACGVPVGDLRGGQGAAAAAAAVDRAFEALVAGLDHPTLRPEVAPAAREAAARVRARCAEGVGEPGALLGGGVEFRLRVVFVDAFDDEEEEEEESDPEPDGGDEEAGSDLEFDEAAWESGASHLRCEPVLAAGGDEDSQFSARPFGGAVAGEGGAALLSGFEARAEGPELGDQHELTARDTQRLVRLALGGGDMEGDEAYQRALGGGAPVSRVSRAVMLHQALRSATQQQQPPPPTSSPPGSPPPPPQQQ
ncbi:hypothetical protein ACP4OV_004979 [Aristida adscensionis]